MILLLIFGCVTLLMGWLAYICTDSKDVKVKKANMEFGIVMSAFVFLIISCFAWGGSYQSYIKLKQQLAVIEQYKETIELYADKGVAEFKTSVTSSRELTDLKYNNYQTQIAQMITDMRDVIVKYNKSLTSKSIMKDNILFNWFIFLPEDLELIKMADYIK